MSTGHDVLTRGEHFNVRSVIRVGPFLVVAIAGSSANYDIAISDVSISYDVPSRPFVAIRAGHVVRNPATVSSCRHQRYTLIRRIFEHSSERERSVGRPAKGHVDDRSTPTRGLECSVLINIYSAIEKRHSH